MCTTAMLSDGSNRANWPTAKNRIEFLHSLGRSRPVKGNDDLTLATHQSEEPSTPCGPCRQLMWEFCGDIDVALANLTGQRVDYKLSTLFPKPFYFSLES